ncbi:MAG: nuclear transport factor 2 family protein [Acidimicrobiia bacterium]|nr:nuclear transport factor 2 family protein [Acidimicrobiia bacterium]
MNDPVETVHRFLRLVEARDLDAASEHLADDVQIVFPGGRSFSDLYEQVGSSAGRFQQVTKVFEGSDVAHDGDDTIVYVFGTLRGAALDGTSFEGVRFIDRFVLRGGRIVDQRVWNDMAESGVLDRG